MSTPEPHHPSWAWRHELWVVAAVTCLGAVVAWGRTPRLEAAAIVLATLCLAQVAVLASAYLREGLRLQREQDRRREDEDRRDHYA